MDEWEEYYKKPNNNEGSQNQQNAYVTSYQRQMGGYVVNGDNMAPVTYNECFTETTATNTLKKWIKVFKICCIVLFVILLIFGVVSAYNSSYVTVKIESDYYLDAHSTRFDLAYFIGYLLGFGIAMFLAFLSFKLTCAVLNCIAQITRNTGISAKLAALNTRNQMMKDASKEKEN